MNVGRMETRAAFLVALLAVACHTQEPAPSLTGSWSGRSANLILAMTVTEASGGAVQGTGTARWCTAVWPANCDPQSFTVAGTRSSSSVALVMRVAGWDSTAFSGWMDTPNGLSGTLNYMMGYTNQQVTFTRAP